jgi:aminopeptidase N
LVFGFWSSVFAHELPGPTSASTTSPGFVVVSYSADLTIAPTTRQLKAGTCTMIVRWTVASQQAVAPFHLRGLTVRRTTLNGKSATASTFSDPSSASFHYDIPVGERAVGAVDTIVIDYNGTFTAEGGSSPWGGVFYQDSTLYTIGVGLRAPYVSTTQHWLPCYDHPSLKAPLRLRIAVRAPQHTMRIASIGSLVSDTVVTINDTLTRIAEWRTDLPTATYLMTFAIGSLAERTYEHPTVPHVVYPRTRDTARARLTFERLPEITDALINIYGAYPLEKVGYVQTTNGAMEHQTLISIPTTVVQSRDPLNSVTAHELAHMWWGDAVSPAHFGHAWLTESFATYSEAAWAEAHGGRSAYLNTLQEKAENYMMNIAKREDTFALVDFPRAAPSSNYPETIYQKGAVVVGMLRALLGDDAFYAACRSYLTQFRYRNAETADLHRVFEEVSGRDLDAFFEEWVYGSGWPQVTENTIRRTENELLVTLKQVQPASMGRYTTLPIEITYTTTSGAQRDTMIVMDRDSVVVVLPDAAEIPAVQFNGGQRVRPLMQLSSTVSVDSESVDGGPWTVDSTIRIVPVPAQEHVVLTAAPSPIERRIEVYDLTGTLVLTHAFTAGAHQATLDVATLPSGTYSVKIGEMTGVVVIER